MLCAISGSKNRKWKPVYKTVFFPNTHYANSFLSSADIGLKLFIDLIYSSNQYKYQKGKGKNWSCFGIIVIFLTPLHQRAYFSFWQGFHLFLLFGTQFFAWCFLSILSWILEGFKRGPTKKLRCLDTFFNFWPFLLVGKPTSLWQKLHWDSLWMQLFFLKPLQFKRLWVVPSWHEWGTHCAKTG